MSQDALSSMVGMNRSFLSDIERGKGNASIDTLVKLADGLNVPITAFFAGAESAPPWRLAQK